MKIGHSKEFPELTFWVLATNWFFLLIKELVTIKFALLSTCGLVTQLVLNIQLISGWHWFKFCQAPFYNFFQCSSPLKIIFHLNKWHIWSFISQCRVRPSNVIISTFQLTYRWSSSSVRVKSLHVTINSTLVYCYWCAFAHSHFDPYYYSNY